jgi:hypothetical protein
MRRLSRHKLLLAELLALAVVEQTTAQSSLARASFGVILLKGGLSDEDWRSAFKDSNATGSVSFPGFNVSAAYPGQASDDWKFIIDVAADVPLGDGIFVTGTWVRMQAPKSLLVLSNNSSSSSPGNETADNNLPTARNSVLPVSDSWKVCQSLVDFTNPGLQVDANTQGRCDGILPDECLSAMKNNLARGYRLDSDGNPDCSSSTPSSCEDFFTTKGTRLNGGIGVTGIDFATDDGLTGIAQYVDPTDYHSKGNDTAYQSAIRQVRIVTLGWGYSNNTDPGSRPDQIGAEIFCLRADQAKNRSRSGAGILTSSYAARIGVWLMVLAVASAFGIEL